MLWNTIPRMIQPLKQNKNSKIFQRLTICCSNKSKQMKIQKTSHLKVSLKISIAKWRISTKTKWIRKENKRLKVNKRNKTRQIWKQRRKKMKRLQIKLMVQKYNRNRKKVKMGQRNKKSHLTQFWRERNCIQNQVTLSLSMEKENYM